MFKYPKIEFTLNVNDAAKFIGVSPATLRNWEKAGLIEPQRGENDYRQYTVRDLRRSIRILEYSIYDNLSLSEISPKVEKEFSNLPEEKYQTCRVELCQQWKSQREARGFTIAQVAEEVDISPSYLSKIEAGQANLSLKIMQRLSRFYGSCICHYLGLEEAVATVRQQRDDTC